MTAREQMPLNLQTMFTRWCQNNRQNIYSNGLGTTILLNFPWELEEKIYEYLPNTANLLDGDTMQRGVIVISTNLPVNLSDTYSKLTQEDKAAIRTARADGQTIAQLADIYSVNRRTISRVVNGHTR
jgi:uncharacterized protein (DUF1684 family)